MKTLFHQHLKECDECRTTPNLCRVGQILRLQEDKTIAEINEPRPCIFIPSGRVDTDNFSEYDDEDNKELPL